MSIKYFVFAINLLCGIAGLRSAHADVITWDLGGKQGELGQSEVYTANGITIGANGLDGGSKSINLFGVSEGEGGQGLQLSATQSVLINFAPARAVGVTGFSFELGGVTGDEEWSVFGVDASGGNHLIMSSNDEVDHVLSGNNDSYYTYIFRDANSDSSGTFFLTFVDGMTAAVPESSTWVMMIVGFFGLASWRTVSNRTGWQRERPRQRL